MVFWGGWNHGGRPGSDPDNPPAPQKEVQNVEEVRTRFGPNLAPKAQENSFFVYGEGKRHVFEDTHESTHAIVTDQNRQDTAGRCLLEFLIFTQAHRACRQRTAAYSGDRNPESKYTSHRSRRHVKFFTRDTYVVLRLSA